MSGINQKEYLKKYLGIGKSLGEKKKRKKSKKTTNRFKIVDDDLDIALNEEIQVDLTADNDEAPQIASIIDDRPPSLRIDELTRNNLWKPIGAHDVTSNLDTHFKFEDSIKLSKDPHQNGRFKESQVADRFCSTNSSSSQNKISSTLQKHKKSDDFASPRRSQSSHDFDSDNSPPRQSKNVSPPRSIKRRESEDKSPPRRSKIHNDSSPTRKIKRERSNDISPRRDPHNNGRFTEHQLADRSCSKNKSSSQNKIPSTLQKHKKSDDFESPRRSQSSHDFDSDNSPPRQNKNVSLPSGDHEKRINYSPPRKMSISKDISPPRRKKKEDNSPPRNIKRRESEDNSPPRRSKIHNDSSPTRKIKRERSNDISPRRDGKHNIAPRQRKDSSRIVKRSRWGDIEEEDEKFKKTLDGKKAGLQNATDLVLETSKLKKREDELFKNMSAEVSGANAATVVRGKKKNIDWEEEERKRKRDEENKEKYDRWGKGLKQVEDVNEKIKNDLYEMSKPLARYADDEDLEKYLKDQEREGDPMLLYIRQKKRKKTVDEGKPTIQQYEGDAPPNRFGIRPGYRWDGVDRSNGYEKQWFQVQNSRMANMEENYKWSTEDM